MEIITEKFDFDDILIVAKCNTDILSRYSDITLPKMLPLFTAPMDTVVDLDNYVDFIDNKINVTLPRTITVKSINEQNIDSKVFIGLGLKEIEDHIQRGLVDFQDNAHILIDVANGHMKIIADYANIIKNIRPDIKIMVGNVANPETYLWYAREDCVDFIRIGVGNGCFVAGTSVTTKNGFKNIEDILCGDEVLTHTGEYKSVVSTKKRSHNNDLVKVNDIVCTPNHEFYVLNKKHINIVNDDNIENLCEWVSAKELLENNEYLLIEIDTYYENNINV